MKVVDIFKETAKGVVIERDGYEEDKKMAFCLDTSNISNCVISTPSSNVETVYMNVKEKHLLQKDDIVVASVPSSLTSHVGYAKTIPEDYPVILKKNIIVLRDCIDKYNPIFVAEYLENIGIKDLYKSGKLSSETPLTLTELLKLDIPDISIEDQNNLVSLFDPINERTMLYKQLVEHDAKIKKYILERMISNEDI